MDEKIEETSLTPPNDPVRERFGLRRPQESNADSGDSRRTRPLPENITATLQVPKGNKEPKTIEQSIEAILVERGKTHGDFTDNAYIMQRLKEVVHASRNWTTMTDVQREALHMILHKVGRICSGNPDVNDHWDDIAGYAKLVSERI